MKLSKNYDYWRYFSLILSGLLLLWWFLNIDLSEISKVKGISTIPTKYIPHIFCLVLLYSVLEFVLNFQKLNENERQKQDTILYHLALIVSLLTLIIIYPKLTTQTYFEIITRLDLCGSIFLGWLLAFTSALLRVHLEILIIYYRLRRIILHPALISSITELAIISLAIFTHYTFFSGSIPSIIHNYFFLVFAFLITYIVSIPKKQLITNDNYQELFKQSKSIDREKDLLLLSEKYKSFIQPGVKRQRKAVKGINKLIDIEKRDLKYNVKSLRELIIKTDNGMLNVNQYPNDTEVISITFRKGDHDEESDTVNIEYEYFVAGIMELLQFPHLKLCEDSQQFFQSVALFAYSKKRYKENPELVMWQFILDRNIEKLKALFKETIVPINHVFDHGGYTALLLAVANGEFEISKYLLEKAADPNIANQMGITPLNFAAKYGHEKLCKLLLQFGAKVNLGTHLGNVTPLMKAAEQGHGNIIKILLENGADASLKDGDGRTAYDYAVMTQHGHIAKILRTN